MKTAIRIALSDPEYAGDQKSCEYDSVTGELTVNNNIEAAYPYRSGVNGYGLIYDASKTEGGIFVYRSDEKINGYSGFDIRTGAKELLGNSPDAPLYAVQYMESKPDWISDGISMAKIKEGLRGTCAWLKVSSAMPPRLKNRGVIAIIVDKLLQATEEETAASTINEASRFTPLLWTEERTIPNAETIEQIAIIAITRADTALVATIEASIVMTVMSCITTIAPILLIIIQSINQSHFISPLPFRCLVCSTNTPLILCIPPIHPNRVQHIHASLIIFDPR